MLRKLYLADNKMGRKILSTVCSPVTVFDQELQKLAQDMADTMKAFHGVGLAAPQIGSDKRVIVVQTAKGVLAYVNPVIVWQSEDIRKGMEGCLSYPGIWKEIPRPNNIIVNGFDLNGKRIEHGYHDFEARIFCHEIDHLNGECRVGKAG